MRLTLVAACLLTILTVPLAGTPASPHNAFPTQKSSAGSMIDLGSRKLYINCSGEAVIGSPTVVLEAGLNASSETWSNIQPEIAKFTRVCSYDRAGMRKSDPSPQQPTTSSQIARELHLLLSKSGVTGRLVLVGHSLGGLIVRMYASLYPKDVAGIVLVDSVHEEETARWLAMLPAETRKEMEARGGKRLLGVTQIDLEKSNAEMQAANWRTRVPLVVLSRGKTSYNPDDYPPQLRSLAPKGEELRIKLQEDLARRSSRSKHIFAEKSGHLIHRDQPELVIDSIRQVVEAARLKNPKSS
ncbi:MAG: alpha/beta hydrolase [Acidobacteriota bacterium]